MLQTSAIHPSQPRTLDDRPPSSSRSSHCERKWSRGCEEAVTPKTQPHCLPRTAHRWIGRIPGLATRYLDPVMSIKNPSMNEIEEVKGEDGWLTSEHKDRVDIAVPPTCPCGYPQWPWGGVTVGATDGRHPPALQPPVEVWRRDGWIPASGGGLAAWRALRCGGVAGFMETEEEDMVCCLWGFSPYVWPTRTPGG
jgi:hypothetical protein